MYNDNNGTLLQASDTESNKSRSHLDSHFYQHEQLLDADPQALASHCLGNAGPLRLLKTAQQLCGGDTGEQYEKTASEKEKETLE